MAAKSIAIIGASNNRAKFSNKCVRAYQTLGWKVFPVNPKESLIEGLKCYPKISDVPEKPSRISIYLQSQVTLALVGELQSFGAKEVILNPGAESDELVAVLKKSRIKPILKCSIRTEGLSPDDF